MFSSVGPIRTHNAGYDGYSQMVGNPEVKISELASVKPNSFASQA
jgi:hypothetical protein